ncbi:hypothetical protein DYH09_00915 [bacterium CPR1]|nr:hypothetical protein [bacterium CPR1]
MSLELFGLVSSLALLVAFGSWIGKRQGRKVSAPPSARDIPLRRLTCADVERSFRSTGKTGEMLFARSEDGSRQITARWTEYAAEGLTQMLVSFVYQGRELRLSEEISDLVASPAFTHKAENLTRVCAADVIREVQRCGPYTLRLSRDLWIAERKSDARPGEAVESALVRFYLDGRQATYVRSYTVKN